MSARVSDLNEIRTGTGAEEWNVDHPHWCLYIGCVMVGRRRDNNIIIIRRRRRRCVYPRSYRVARPNPVFRYCRRLLDLGTNPSPPYSVYGPSRLTRNRDARAGPTNAVCSPLTRFSIEFT